MHLPAILGAWGSPPDPAAWVALGLSVVAIAIANAPHDATLRMEHLASSRRVVTVLAFAAALLSLAYVAFYLGGGPRIVDATSYFLQARALSEGHFAWHVPEPTASFRGRFLLFDGPAGKLAGIFPPGYPLLLSLGFSVGAPLVVGPVLAAAIVVATWGLARELARQAGLDRHSEETVARTAACLSVVCAALRYHTADTMAHGACALAFTLAILAAIRAQRERLPWFFLLAGLALGFVVATRFASALALGSVLAWLAWSAEGRAKKTALAACLLGAAPGVLLLVVAQSASTGHALVSAQSAYYAASDGPPGCFRYGFGAGIGCLVEHGDFVRARASDGYGLLTAIGVTLRRLRMHAQDVANFEPLALFVLVPLLRARSRTPGVRACSALVGAIIAAYAPFYFDGDYPGGGARFFADVLPVEHALLAIGVALVARSWAEIGRAGGAALALSLLGFSVHAAYDHEQLRARDGGHPMFDPEVFTARSLGVTPRDGSPPPASLVFFETDHGFNLAHDPEKADRAAEAVAKGTKPSGALVARLRSDDHDRLLYERLGRPSAWVYHFLPDSPKSLAQAARLGHDVATGDLQPWAPSPAWPGGAEIWRFEAENEWPPLAQTGKAWAEPIWATDTCASPTGNGRALAIHGGAPEGGSVVLALPIPRPGAWRVTPRFLVDAGSPGVRLEVLAPDGTVLARWEPAETSRNGAATPASQASAGEPATKTCFDAPGKVLTSAGPAAELRLSITPVTAPAAPAAPTAPSPAKDDAAHLTALDRVLLAPTSR
jgi:hypothetical protein